MSMTDRCDEIIRLIDEVLDENAAEFDVHRLPPPPRMNLQLTSGIPRMRALTL
jgi:hypothetical protein